jgi:hypothetical protein
MPKLSGVTFAVQPVETDGKTSGFVVSGFMTKAQLEALRDLVDNEEYERSKRWRGTYQEMAKAIVSGIDNALS